MVLLNLRDGMSMGRPICNENNLLGYLLSILKNIERVKSRIEDAKSLRDSFDVGQGFLTSGNCSVAGTVQFVTKISVKEL